MRRLWAFTLFLMFLTTAPRTGQAEGESPPPSERLQAMIAAGEIGTDEAFQRLKKEREWSSPTTGAAQGHSRGYSFSSVSTIAWIALLLASPEPTRIRRITPLRSITTTCGIPETP